VSLKALLKTFIGPLKMQTTLSKPIFLIRHGESEHNLAMNESRLQRSGVNLEVKFHPNYIDALMTLKGREQAEKAGALMKDKNIKHVICSPIRRCIETAKIVFKDHPNSPKILINPMFRELQCCVADMGSPLDEIEKLFSDIDFTSMRRYEEPHIWHITDSYDEVTRTEIIEEIKKRATTPEEQKKVAHVVLIEKMKLIYPKTLESHFEVSKRVKKCKEELKAILGELKEDETVAVVSHHGFLDCFTAMKLDEEYKPLDGMDLANCEVREYIVE